MSRQPGQTATSYLDGSALVKRYLVETGTPWVQTWCDDPVQTVAVLDISHYAYLCECEIATAWAQARGDLAAGRYRAESADTHTARIHTERTQNELVHPELVFATGLMARQPRTTMNLRTPASLNSTAAAALVAACA